MENIDIIIPLLNFQTFIIIMGITFTIFYKCSEKKIRNVILTL